VRNWIAFSIALLPFAVHAEDRCPWMNRATAGGLLGGEASMRVTAADADNGSCAFELRQGDSLSRLTIQVTTMRTPKTDFASYLARCPNGTPLKAIGNEAVTCPGTDHDERFEQVVGRVRDHAFIVRVSTTGRGADAGALRERAAKAAEQVAGILF